MWRLRRLGPRAAQLAERYADWNIVATRSATLLPTLGAFTRAYDEVRRGAIPWSRDAESGRRAVYDLVLAARMWLPMIVRDLPWIDRSNYLDSPISDDLIDDIEQLVTLLRDGRGPDGEHLAYRDEAIERLDRSYGVAHAKWYEAEAADIAYAERMNDLRWKAVSFRAELEWFTQALVAVLGHDAPDVLRLLPSRAWHQDTADDAQIPCPEVVEPATLVTGIPKLLEA